MSQELCTPTEGGSFLPIDANKFSGCMEASLCQPQSVIATLKRAGSIVIDESDQVAKAIG